VTIPHIVAGLIALVGCWTDVQSRRIPNVLTFGSALGAFAYYLVVDGLAGVGWSIGGWALGVLIWFPMFLLRGLGGGDIKLLGALGAWLGPVLAIWLALYAALAGGVFALAVMLHRGYVRKTLANVWGLLVYWRVAGMRPHPALSLDSPSSSAARLPYALPIAAGLVVTLWLK
jgi:prepilin peptidase CpaA